MKELHSGTHESAQCAVFCIWMSYFLSTICLKGCLFLNIHFLAPLLGISCSWMSLFLDSGFYSICLWVCFCASTMLLMLLHFLIRIFISSMSFLFIFSNVPTRLHIFQRNVRIWQGMFSQSICNIAILDIVRDSLIFVKLRLITK
jgi:hypothetical protein